MIKHSEMASVCDFGYLTNVTKSVSNAGDGPAFVAYSELTASNVLVAAVPNSNSRDISTYVVDQATGALTNQSTVSFARPGDQPVTVGFSPLLPNSQMFAVVCNGVAGSEAPAFAIYRVSSKGTFQKPTYTANDSLVDTPVDAQFSPLVNGHLYLALAKSNSKEIGNTLTVWEVDQTDGSLRVLTSPSLEVFRPRLGLIAFSPPIENKVFVAVSQQGPALASFTGAIAMAVIDSETNVVSEATPFAYTNTGIAPIGLAFLPAPSTHPLKPGSPLFLVVCNSDEYNPGSGDSSVWVYEVDTIFQPGTLFDPKDDHKYALNGLNPNVVRVSPSVCLGRSLVLVSNFGANSSGKGPGLDVFQADTTTGNLTLLPTLFSSGDAFGPDCVAICPLLGPNAVLFAASTNFASNGTDEKGVFSYSITMTANVSLTGSASTIAPGDLSVLEGTVIPPYSGPTMVDMPAPFNVTWSDLVFQTSAGQPFTRNVNPLVTTTYQVLELTQDGNPLCFSCPSNEVEIQVFLCLHGASLVHMADPKQEYKRIDEIVEGDVVRTAELGVMAIVDKVCKCWVSPTNGSVVHDALVLEANCLGEGQPSQRLILDPGHPICTREKYGQLGQNGLRPAASWATAPLASAIIKWKDERVQRHETEGSTLRYDLVLHGSSRTYMANGLIIQSRDSYLNAGYAHHHGGSV